MKRYDHLYPQIYTMDNLTRAHVNARRGKAFYSEVKMVNKNPELYLSQICDMLENKTYETSPYDIFMRFDGKKEREIYRLPYYPDRIIHWAIMQVLGPIWDRTFIYDTYSSIHGRGIHFGLKRIHQALRDKENTTYCLKFDVKKFYPSINHAILKQIIRKKIKDNDVLWLLDGIVESVGGGHGAPIGNYLSQYLSNLYLTYFDHWVKEDLRMHYYFRYCDDCVILHQDPDVLHTILERIEEYLATQLQLTLKSNYQIFPTTTRGVDFLGYRSFGDYTSLRKSIATRAKRKMTNLSLPLTAGELSSVASYHGWMKWCDAFNLEQRYVAPLTVGE
jgi:retron-type reverse transcriptase